MWIKTKQDFMLQISISVALLRILSDPEHISQHEDESRTICVLWSHLPNSTKRLLSEFGSFRPRRREK